MQSMASKAPVCRVRVVDIGKVNAVKKQMTDDMRLAAVAKKLKAMADRTRLKILDALSNDELCVCDIASILGMSLSATSHQLGALRAIDMVKFRREGKCVYYSLADPSVVRIMKMATAASKA